MIKFTIILAIAASVDTLRNPLRILPPETPMEKPQLVCLNGLGRQSFLGRISYMDFPTMVKRWGLSFPIIS